MRGHALGWLVAMVGVVGCSAPMQADDGGLDASASDASGHDASVDAGDAARLDAGSTDAGADAFMSSDAGTDAMSPDASMDDAGADAFVAIDAGQDAFVAIDVGLDAPTCVAEDCYDGVDDDCDGLVDCADSDCTPSSECVDDASGFALGTLAAAACPSGYDASTTSVMSGLSAPASCSSCTCSPQLVCEGRIDAVGAPCPGSVLASTTTSSSGCTSISLPSGTAGLVYGSIAPVTSCVAGVAAPDAISWAASQSFCATTQEGAGCGAGRVCVPRLAGGARHCVSRPGSASCPGTYTPTSGGTWYTGVVDARSCSTCSCGSATGGSCGTSRIELFAGFCGGVALSSQSGMICAGSISYNHSDVILVGTAAPSCGAGSGGAESGTATPTGATTVCCL